MRIEGPGSSNVEDRRGMSRGGKGIVGGGIGMVILVVVGMLFGIDPRVILGLAGTVETVQNMGASQQQVQGKAGPPSDEMGRFVAGVLADTEKTWGTLFQQLGRQYREPALVLFTGATPTACGTGQTAMGPFYCPLDQKVYIDLRFYQALRDKFRAPGDFAQAYVISHEVGHHVQNQLGILSKVQQQQKQVSKTQANQLQVRVELQADCLAGVWAAKSDQQWKLIEPGDVEAAMRTAAAIGDDRLQKQAQGYVIPDSFTHGSSEQRQRWFETGLKSANIQACNTFSASAQL
jgi:predicted metalloprotease